MQRRLGRFHPINSFDARITPWLARQSLPLMRMSLGLVFLAFGILKFIPGASPAEDMAKDVMDGLTLGLMPGWLGLVLVAAMETAIGLSLLTGRYLRVGIALLGMAMVGVLSPLVLFPGDLFSREYNAPTLAGQYVVKDVVLLTAALVVGLRERGAVLVMEPERMSPGKLSGGPAGD